jgi:hypothetical protein
MTWQNPIQHQYAHTIEAQFSFYSAHVDLSFFSRHSSRIASLLVAIFVNISKSFQKIFHINFIFIGGFSPSSFCFLILIYTDFYASTIWIFFFSLGFFFDTRSSLWWCWCCCCIVRGRSKNKIILLIGFKGERTQTRWKERARELCALEFGFQELIMSRERRELAWQENARVSQE